MSTSRRELFQLASVAAAGAAPLGAMTKEDDPASILSVFARRQTVRRYKPDPVPEAHLLQILDAARRGPTCMNQQPWTFLVIRDPAKIQAMKTRTLELVAKFVSADKKEAALHFTEGYFTAPVYV